MAKRNSITKTKTDLAIGAFRFTGTGLVVSGKPTQADWRHALYVANTMYGAVNWVIGDLILEGPRVLGGDEEKAEEIAAELLTNVSESKRKQCQWVSATFKMVNRLTNLSWTHHLAVCGIGNAQRRQSLLRKAEKEDWSVAQLKLEVRQLNNQKLIESNPLPSGAYNVVYADPPWRYEFSETDNRKIENHYPTMELDAICSLEVSKLCHSDCVLFLWTTSPKLEEAWSVIESWEFLYRTCLVWVKDKIGMGYYARQKHELLLVATKGSPSVPEPASRPPSVFEYPRGKHSEKPELVYGMIEQMYPKANRIELFSRKRRKGWKSWGNEL